MTVTLAASAMQKDSTHMQRSALHRQRLHTSLYAKELAAALSNHDPVGQGLFTSIHCFAGSNTATSDTCVITATMAATAQRCMASERHILNDVTWPELQCDTLHASPNEGVGTPIRSRQKLIGKCTALLAACHEAMISKAWYCWLLSVMQKQSG